MAPEHPQPSQRPNSRPAEPPAPERRTPGLRARRREQTQALIHEAAVELFERQGVKATTVEDIASSAGVSSRTFFRHFATKEQAALPGQRRMRQAIESLVVDGVGPQAGLRAVEAMASLVIASEPQHDLREHQRVRRILTTEPDVRGLATAQEQELVILLRDRLLAQDRPGLDPVTARLTAEMAMAVWRSCWDHWAELMESGQVQDPVDLYGEFCLALRRILA